MNLETAPLYRGDQSWGRRNVVREVLKFLEQTHDRTLEFLDMIPRRDTGTIQERGLEGSRLFADAFERGADFDCTWGRCWRRGCG